TVGFVQGCVMGKKKRNRKNPTISSPEVHPAAKAALPEPKTDWFGIVAPFFASLFFGVVLANNDSTTVTLVSWLGMLIACAWTGFKLWKASGLAFLLKFNIALAATMVFALVANWNITERVQASYVFINPGLWFLDGRWDFIVNHRGPKTS